MNDDVDLLLCTHTKVYLQVNTCADRARCPLLGTIATLCIMVVQGVGLDVVRLNPYTHNNILYARV